MTPCATSTTVGRAASGMPVSAPASPIGSRRWSCSTAPATWRRPRFRFGVGLPAGDSTDVRIVDDERICERAARVYGLDTGPPRRVVVVDAVGFLVVYDPAEPVTLGEYNQWLVIDRRFRVLARLVL